MATNTKMSSSVSSDLGEVTPSRRIDDPFWHLVLILLVIVPLFAVNGRWGQNANADTTSVAVPAWQLANQGTLDLSEYEAIADNLDELDRWYVTDADGRVVSNRMPGLIALATPAYLVAGESFTNAPATAMALVVTVAALLVMWVAFRKVVPLNWATAAVLVFGLGTTTWAISSAELWPHGPGQLWAALAVLSVGAAAYGGAGLSYALSITTRPVTGVFAAVTGIAESWRSRSWKPALKIGAISALGLAAYLIYNRILFGSWSLSGGYPDKFSTAGAIARFDILSYLNNLLALFVGPLHGFLTTSPIFGVAAYGAIKYRKSLRPWMLSLAAAGVAYLVVHAGLNRASGGAVVFYRYQLEAMVLMSPALLIGAKSLWESSKRAERVVFVAAAVSIALQVLNVFIFSCWYTSPIVEACLLQ